MPSLQELAARVSLISESSTLKVFADADRLRREGKDVVDFSAGEPDFPTPDNIKAAAKKALDENFTKYTVASGTPELKQAICEHHKRTYGTTYVPKECIVTVGGKHAIFNLTQVLLDPGDEVIIPVPYWVTFKDVVNYAGGKCVFVETHENDNFSLHASAVERAITSKTKMIILNSPSNPSGALFERAELEKIFRLAKDRGIWVLADECYERFLYDSQPFSIAQFPDAKDTVVVAGSLSKTYAMTGWRVGFVLGPAPVVSGLSKLQSHETSNPTSIAQQAAVEALGRGDARRIPQAPRLHRRSAAEDSRRDHQHSARSVLRLPERERGVPQGHHEFARICSKAARRRVCRPGPGRGLRNQRACPHLLRDLDP
jgi:aspartate aminotransferase